MYKKKKLENKYYVIIILVIIGITLAIMSFLISDKRNLSFPEKAFKDSVLFVEKIVMAPINLVVDKIDEVKEKNKLYDKYEDMRDKYEQTKILESKYKEVVSENDKLKKILDLNNSLSDYSYLHATVINRNIDYWQQTITIDKGLKNGVEKDCAVITPDGLIGKVISVSNFNSTVKLLTSSDSSNKISVKIDEDGVYIYGLLSMYQTKNKTFIIEGIAENTKISEGSKVVTTGLGNNFPSGIIIGKVVKVSTDNFDLARTVEMTSSSNFDDITHVTILKRKIVE